MGKLRQIALSLSFALALSSCASTGRDASPRLSCPQLPPPPASLMQEPTTEQQVRAELFEPLPSAMRKCADCNPW